MNYILFCLWGLYTVKFAHSVWNYKVQSNGLLDLVMTEEYGREGGGIALVGVTVISNIMSGKVGKSWQQLLLPIISCLFGILVFIYFTSYYMSINNLPDHCQGAFNFIEKSFKLY